MRPSRFVLLILLMVFFGMLLNISRSLSLTVDEPAHIAVGYAVLDQGMRAFWLLPIHGHPPLLNVLEAVLLHIASPDIPLEQLPGWNSKDYMRYLQDFTSYLVPIERTEIGARMPVIWLTLLLGALTYRWGKELRGKYAGLIALGVLCFDPNLLAHGSLATTDVGTVTLGTASLYLIWKWEERPSWRTALGSGVLLGLTMLAKVNGLIWAGAIGLFLLLKILRGCSTERGLLLAQGVIGGLAGFLIVWAGHGFTWGPVRGLPGAYPAPTYWEEVVLQARSGQGLLTYAWGTLKTGNRWWYFPLAFLIKNPLPLQISLIWALVRFSQTRTFSCRYLILIAFSILYASVAVLAGMNIGYRHLLPTHPAIYIVVGTGIASLLKGKSQKWIVALLGLWYVGGTLRIFPHEIAYFNELVGGPYNGHHYLVDSNLDWGQALKELRRWLDSHDKFEKEPIYVAAVSHANLYGISYHPYQWVSPTIGPPLLYSRFAPPPGIHAIGASVLQGIGAGEPDNFDWFRHQNPIARPGIAFFVYRVSPPDQEPTWVAQCTVPVVPLTPEAVADGFGRHNLRSVHFDCTAGWVYPSGGQNPGWFILFRDTAYSDDPFIHGKQTAARLSYEQRYPGILPPFVIYEQSAEAPYPDTPYPEKLQVGALDFLGHQAILPKPGQVEIETWWQVREVPTRPLSIMMHLIGPEGMPAVINDGLAVPVDQWRPGDIIIQRHRLSLPPGALPGKYSPFTGVYWLDTMERWMVMKDGQPISDQISLSPIYIQ